jgi:hypothetical protein
MEIKVTLTNSKAEQFIFIVTVDGKEVQNCTIGNLVNPEHFDWACNMSAAAVHGNLQTMNPVKRKVCRTPRALDKSQHRL